MRKRALILLVCLLPHDYALGDSATLTAEPNGETYNFTTHYRVQISASREAVWPVLLDLKSWMYEFELTPVTPDIEGEGRVLRLYSGQAFEIQISKIVPLELLSIVNLPLNFEGELTTGVGIITLHENASGCEVSVTMSRRYTWTDQGENPVRAVRETAAFQEQTRAMWQDRFLRRLKERVEANYNGKRTENL